MHGLSAIINGENTILWQISVEKDNFCFLLDLRLQYYVPIDKSNRHILNMPRRIASIYEFIVNES